MRKEDCSLENFEVERFANTYGIGTIVFNRFGEILVGTEKIAKERSGRANGQISVPMETLKPFERKNRKALLLASMSEIVTDENISRLVENLREVGIDGPIQLNDKGLEGAIAVFIWSGEPGEIPFYPSNPDEFRDLRWIDPDAFRSSELTRPYAITLIDYALSEGYSNESASIPFVALQSFRPGIHVQARDIHEDVK